MHIDEDGSSTYSPSNARCISRRDIAYQFLLFVRIVFHTQFLYTFFYFLFSRGPLLRHPHGSPFRLILELSAALLSVYHFKIE